MTIHFPHTNMIQPSVSALRLLLALALQLGFSSPLKKTSISKTGWFTSLKTSWLGRYPSLYTITWLYSFNHHCEYIWLTYMTAQDQTGIDFISHICTSNFIQFVSSHENNHSSQIQLISLHVPHNITRFYNSCICMWRPYASHGAIRTDDACACN